MGLVKMSARRGATGGIKEPERRGTMKISEYEERPANESAKVSA